MAVHPILQFGDFQFDVKGGLLRHGSQCLDLTPKALEVLAVLVRNAGRVVTKDELLAVVWPEAAVEEGNLAVHVCAVRRALGGDAGSSGYIQTIPKRGYRFAHPITEIRRERPSSPEGHTSERIKIAEQYLQQQTPAGCRKAEEVFRACSAEEPENVRAKAGTANTLLFRMVLGDVGRDEVAPQVQALLKEASEIDSSSAELHLSRSRFLCLSDWQLERAEEELELAFETARDNGTGSIARAWRGFDLVVRGQLQTGLSELCLASEDCPLSTFVWRMLAEGHYLARDFHGSIAVSRNALQLHPGCSLVYRTLSRALSALGEFGEARQAVRRAIAIHNRPQMLLQAENAYLDAMTGDRGRAVRFLSHCEEQRSGQQFSPVLIAEIYTALGSRERAQALLEKAWLRRDPAAVTVKQNPRLDVIRNTPGYRSVIAKLG